MNKSKKAQLGSLLNWFIAFAIIFAIIVGYLALMKPWQKLDNTISPMVLNLTKKQASDPDPIDTIKVIRKYWIAFPIVLIASLILWAYMSSLRQDPNYPYQ